MSNESFLAGLARRIRYFLPKGRFARSAAILAGGTILAQGLGVIVAPVLTRLYSPSDFGILAVFSSILSISLNFASFRYEFAIPLPEDNQKAVDLLCLCVVSVLITSSLFIFGILFFDNVLGQIQQFIALKQFIWLLPIGFFFAGIYQALNYWAVRERAYSLIAQTRVSQGVSDVATQLSLGVLKFGPLGLLLGHIIGQSVGVGTLARQFWKKNKKNISLVSVASLRAAAYRYKDFPLYQSNASLLNTAGLQIPALLFAGCYGAEVAGWFFLTQKLLAMPITLVGTSVSKVFLGEAAQMIREPSKLQKLFRKINLKLLLIGVGPCLILAVGGPWIFKFVFGAQWVQSGVYVQVMAFVFLLKLTTDSVINFAIIERQDLSFSWALMRLVFVVLGIMTAVWCGLSGFWAVVFFAGAMIVSYLIKYGMWNYAITQLIAKKG